MVLSIEEYNSIINYKLKNEIPKFDNYIQSYRFKEKSNKFLLKNDLLYFNEKLVLNNENITLNLNNDYKNVIGGRDKLYFHIKNKYYKVTRNDVMFYLKNNEINQIFKKPLKSKVVKPIISNEVNERWQIDFIIMNPLRNFKYILNIIDHHSKYAFAFPVVLRNHKIMNKILEPLFEKYKPKYLQSDNEFKSFGLEKLCEKYNVKQIYSSSYNPHTNGAIERFNQTFKSILFKIMAMNNSKDWYLYTPEAIRIYNSTYHSTIKDTPINVFENKINKKREIKNQALKMIKPDKDKYKVGDIVRVKLEAFSSERKNLLFKKYYDINYTKEKFKIITVSKHKIKPKQYLLQSLSNNLKGKKIFYFNDLLLINEIKF
jgi:transposase InsO family protein